MAQSSSIEVCSEEKMVTEESPQKKAVSSTDGHEFLLAFDPQPQRILQLNRRKFFNLNRDQDKESKTSSPSLESACKKSDCKKPGVSQDRLKPPPTSGHKIIKLVSNNTVPVKQNGIKRNSTVTSSQSTVPAESPPKKKHKPITWP
ncbi:hypothetical protein JTE90_028637 [Oedothorax gibbosus]|uniref:Uncharacterized protein n=1 Tax=Oedothorax gibbosus TaxID=931172 RepID=A0AAV6UZQ2_9ARAC|nr:hypothetical protein JTE90_028637 [Oedothorax gibbosus]